jgi:enoyl-CoA hydratase/carnithine racemase
MTLPMDIRIVADNAKLGAVFVRRGIVSDGCSSFFMPRVLGMANAMRMVITGKTITAREALEMGFAYRVVKPEEVYPLAREIALDLAKNTAPVSVALVRRLLWQMQGAAHPMEAHEAESQLLYWVGRQPDAAEGINSFLEKRQPEYTMSPIKDLPGFYPMWQERTFRNQ